MTSDPRDVYFATLGRDEIGIACMQRATSYFTSSRVLEILAKQRLAYRYYYDLGLDWAGWGDIGPTNAVTRGGGQGELALVRINHWRANCRSTAAMISSVKFEWKPRASRPDYDAMEAARRSRYALDHYYKSGTLEQRRVESIESATVLGVGIEHDEWDPSLGRVIAFHPQTNLPVRTGDVRTSLALPWDLICDPWQSWDEQQWTIVRIPRRNKFDLVTQQLAAARVARETGDENRALAIEANIPKIMLAPRSTIAFFTPAPNDTSAGSTDTVEVYRFYHLPSPSLPGGRDVTFLADGTVLDFHDLEWDMLPIVRRTDGPSVMGSPFGYATSWESLGVQELYDSLQSTVATNQTTFGVQNVAYKKGIDPRPIQLAGGMAGIACDDPTKDIVPMQLTKSPAEIFPHMSSLRDDMARLQQQTSVDRGEAQGDRQSGAALAVLAAQSVRNANPFQTSDVVACKRQGLLHLKMLRAKATHPLRVGITEPGQTTYQDEFSGKDLGDVDAVDIELESPPENNVALLQTMAQLKIPLDAKQAMAVIATGRLEEATDPVTKEGLRIKLENKLIRQGKTPRAMLSDDHLRHGKGHTELMSDDGRDVPVIQSGFLKHQHEHYSLYYGVPLEPAMMPVPLGPDGLPALDPNGLPMPPQPMLRADGQPMTQVEADPLYRVRMMVLCGVQPPPPGPEEMPAGTPPPEPGETDATSPPASGKPSATAAPKPPAQRATNPSTDRPYNPQDGGGTPQPRIQ